MTDARDLLRPFARLEAQDAIGSIDEINSVASLFNPIHDVPNRRFASGELLFARGWISAAPFTGVQPETVRLLVDGDEEFPSVAGVERPDVASTLHDRAMMHTGFIGVFSTRGLRIGEHALSVFAVGGAPANRYDLATRAVFSVVEAEAMIPVDEPATGIAGCIDDIDVHPLGGYAGAQAQSICIRGWACDLERQSPALAVYGVLPGSGIGRAVYGFPRPDVATVLGDPAFTYCGFVLRIFTHAPVFDRSGLRVLATTADGLRHGSIGRTRDDR